MTTGSSQNVRNAQSNFLTVDTQRRKAFIFQNDFDRVTLRNDTGAEKTFPLGTVLGRIGTGANLGDVKAFTSTATDGSQFVVGILAQPVTLADGATQDVEMCIAGRVDSRFVILDRTGDTLDTPVNNRLVRDKIAAESKGIEIDNVIENTFLDN